MHITKLDQKTLELFEQKGKDGSPLTQQTGNENATKVRRVIQLLTNLSKKPLKELKVLDLACGEGVYSIETALLGAKVLAVDARDERMKYGEAAAKRNNLTNLEFALHDVRTITTDSHGKFDVVYFLGILYHLNVPDSITTLENIYGLCEHMLIIDTHVSLTANDSFPYKGMRYEGRIVREHQDTDNEQQRKASVLMSIDNTFSFYFTKPSLIELLTHIGFTIVMECYAPLDPFKPQDRITLVAIKSDKVQIASYPWINAMPEHVLQFEATPSLPPSAQPPKPKIKDASYYLGAALNTLLKPIGYQVKKR
jgi:SAM-dependent methyltransferase